MTMWVKTARLLHEVSELWNDRRYSIRTAGHLLQSATGVTDVDANEYAATPYRVIRRLFRHLPPRCFEGAFLDYGSGWGRVTIVASGYGFQRVIGLELSEVLLRRAHENVQSARVRRRCAVELVRTDAARFEVPDDVSVVYFYNPFGPATTQRVFERIGASLRRKPRELWILSYNAGQVVELARNQLGAEVVHGRSTVYPTISWTALRVSGDALAPQP